MNKSGKLAIAFLFLVGGVLVLVTAAARSRRPSVSVKPLATQKVARDQSKEWLTEYTLTDQSGQQFGSADLAGTPHVVNFFFASCPSYCRMQTMEVQKLAAQFGPQGIAFLSITCDPDNDQPAALQQYASMFNANTEHWKFLTGDIEKLRRVGAEMYEVPVNTQTHSEHLIVIDKWGKTRGRFRWQKHPEELAELKELLPVLLAETDPPPEPPPAPAIVIDEETGLPMKASQLATLPTSQAAVDEPDVTGGPEETNAEPKGPEDRPKTTVSQQPTKTTETQPADETSPPEQGADE